MDQTLRRPRAGRSVSSSANGSFAPSSSLELLSPWSLLAWAREEGLSTLRTRRILHGVYGDGATDLSGLVGVGRDLRERVARVFHTEALPVPRAVRTPDGTVKLTFALADGGAVETVLIPEGQRRTVCVSTQVGCAMGCDFCATAKLGLRRNLSAAEIIGQLQAVRAELADGERITNVVFMGMGEPLHNLDAVLESIEAMRADWGFGLSGRRVTVSTVGLLPQLERLVAATDTAIAISLTATTDQLRNDLMPVNRRYPLADIVETCRRLPIAQRRRITFEYVLLDGVNDGEGDADRLVELLRGVRAKVNLIPFNPHPHSRYQRPSDRGVRRFQDRLLAGRLSATVRKTRGDSVSAACGQLAGAGL